MKPKMAVQLTRYEKTANLQDKDFKQLIGVTKETYDGSLLGKKALLEDTEIEIIPVDVFVEDQKETAELCKRGCYNDDIESFSISIFPHFLSCTNVYNNI
jgi:hypothetical protein